MVRTVPPTPTTTTTPGSIGPSPGPASVPFHVIMLVDTNGGGLIGWNADQAIGGPLVREVNDQQSLSDFYYGGYIRACGWPPGTLYCPPVPQVDFKTRTVLLASPAEACCDNLTLTSIINSGQSLQLYGITTALRGLHCYYFDELLFPVLIVDVPKTHLPATLTSRVVPGPPCSNSAGP